MRFWGFPETLVVVPLLAGDSRIEVTYPLFVMFKGNVTFAAAGTDKEIKPGGGEGGSAKVTVEMRERYSVSRFIVSPMERIISPNTGDPHSIYPLSADRPWRMFVEPF